MDRIIFCSHGRLCEGMLDTLKIFSLYDEKMVAIPFYTEAIDGEGLLNEVLDSVTEEDQVVIFTDVQFGSVNQCVMQKCKERENIHVISGMNLMIVLEVLSAECSFDENFIRQKVLDCQSSIVYMKDMKVDMTDEDE